MVINTNFEEPKFVGWWKGIDATIHRCPHCQRDYVSGDGQEDYCYRFCPYCGKILIKEKDISEIIKEMEKQCKEEHLVETAESIYEHELNHEKYELDHESFKNAIKDLKNELFDELRKDIENDN